MANEYLTRRFTSTGNLREGTFSFWLKGRPYDTNQTRPIYLYDGVNLFQMFFERTSGTNPGSIVVYGAGADIRYKGVYRDPSAWSHYLVKVDNTINGAEARFEVYVNGVRLEIVGSQSTSSASYPNRDVNVFNNVFYINGTGNGAFQCCDYFYVDGQALTPDVFGFYKQGKGYISVGSTQATDFRPGQWVPKTPRVIKTEINRRGGFGVNGFYLPMNDSRNFGADFHGDPNSIITLNEKLPQPRVGVATTASVGLGYTDALRADPYAANLVLALPFVSGGLNSGFGDYSAAIKGSGSAKTITTTSVSIASTASYYGSAMYAAGPNNYATAASSSDFNFGTGDFTVECWIYLLSQGNNGYNHYLSINDQNTFAFKSWGSYYYLYANSTTAVQTANAPRLNQWNHLALVRKGTTLTIFENGVAAGITTNYTSSLGATATAQIGNASNTTTEGLNGYIQDLRIYKGVAKYTGGFDVPRPYTPVGIATWRAVPDTTANNFATLNPLSSLNVTYSNGNLSGNISQTTGATYAASNVGVSSGKWYWETRWDTDTGGGAGFHIGVASDTFPFGGTTRPYQLSSGFAYLSGGGKITNNVSSSYGASYTVGDILGTALDIDNKTVSFYKNGSNQGVAFTFAPGSQSMFVANSHSSTTASGVYGHSINFGQNPTFSGNTTAGTFTDSNGKGLFKYQPPSGFLALCEDNLPTPAISNPGQYFKTVLYTGDGNSGRSIVGVGFTPDLVWIKNRNSTTWHIINDSVRGPNRALYSNQTYSENQTGSNPVLGSVLSFNSDGFSLAVDPDSNANNGWNNNGSPIVAWCWRAGAGTTSTNTNGSVTSVVSVNQDAGFSIVSYPSGQGSNFTIGHGLNKAPKLIIAKSRDAATDWGVYFTILGTNTNWMTLNSTNALGTNNSTLSGGAFMISNPTTLQISTTAFANQGTRAIAYCWAEIEGFSKFGSYVGNGSADGPFVFCNFSPAFVMIKRTDSTQNWIIIDNARSSTNTAGQSIFANTSDTEYTDLTNREMDFLSNGFKIRAGSGTERNASGGTYIFAAFAQSPFSHSNSK